jgi:competence protein ComEA
MQRLTALAQHKLKVFAAIALILGGLILYSTWMGQAASTLEPLALEQPDLMAAQAASEAQATPEATDEPAENAVVVVYISGAVRAPDVYQLPKQARIKDLVVAAGGFADDAAPDQINLAERLTDGQHIHVPRLGEPAAPTDNGSAPKDEPAAQQLLDINIAGQAELDGLPGIGQALAQRIIDYRTSNGAFKSVDDLRNVKGIGPALFEKIAPLITVGP